MKFCMVTTFYPPYHFGGDATYVRSLSEALVKRGHSVTVVHCEDAYRLQAGNTLPSSLPSGGVDIRRIRHAGGFLSPLVTHQFGVPGLKRDELARVFAEGYDVVNFHNISLIGGPGIIPMSSASATLYTLHEFWLLCPTHVLWKNRRKPCDSRQCFRCSIRSGIPPQLWRYTSTLRNSLRGVDAFIAPSDFTASKHKELLDLEAPIEVLPLYSKLDPGEGMAVKAAAAEFLYVGRITPSKGLADLLKSFTKWPQFTINVIGDGDQLPALRKSFEHCPNIRFLGNMPQDALIQHYRAATAVILPSLMQETFGLTVVEGFACGTPAVVRVPGGNRETVEAGGAGFLYEDENGLYAALQKLAASPGLRDELGVKARRAYEEHYTEERHVSRYLRLVQRVLSGKGGAIELRDRSKDNNNKAKCTQ